MSTRHINPEGLHRSPAFSQAAVVEQPTKTTYIGAETASTPTARSSAHSSPAWPPGCSSRSTLPPSFDAPGAGLLSGSPGSWFGARSRIRVG